MKVLLFICFLILTVFISNIPTTAGGSSQKGEKVYDPILHMPGCDCTQLSQECTCQSSD